VDEHLREICTMRLVLGLGQDELDGAAEAEGIAGGEQRALACGHGPGHVAPECDGALVGQRVHEAHRCSALDAVDQDGGELVDLDVVERVQPLHRPVLGRQRFHAASAAITTA
jgi:hypothetical protein